MRTDLDLPRVLIPSIAAEFGLTRARVRTELGRGNWRMMARGALLTRPEDPTRGDWAALGIALGGASAALSGWDAVRVRGLGDARPPTSRVLVLSRHAANRVVGQVRIRETQRAYTVTTTSPDAFDHPLTPVVGTARAIADAAPFYRWLTPVRALVTSAVQRNLCTTDELLAELEVAPRQGSGFLRLALRDAADGARSVAEAVGARKLARSSIPAFELNVPIINVSGRLIAVADVFWRALRAVLEIDSREYHFSERDWKRTLARHNLLTRLGLAVTHHPPAEVMGRGRGWLDETGWWLAARARELGVAIERRHGVIQAGPDGPAPFVVTARAA